MNDPELLEPYVDRYFEALVPPREPTSEIATQLVEGLYPPCWAPRP